MAGSTAVDAALAEIISTIAATGLEYEGIKDLLAINIKPDTHREVEEARVDYARRFDLMTAFQAAAKALLDDGYPDLAIRTVSETVDQDIADQEASIAAARRKFSSNQATRLQVSGMPPVPKTPAT